MITKKGKIHYLLTQQEGYTNQVVYPKKSKQYETLDLTYTCSLIQVSKNLLKFPTLI